MRIFLFFSLMMLCFSSVWADRCPQWSHTRATQEHQALKKQLNEWNRTYRIQGYSAVSDATYDALLERLRLWERCFPFLSALDEKLYGQQGQIAHPVVHTGLAKARNREDVVRWLLHQPVDDVWLQPKIDGVAVTLVYENGIFSRAVSRGDGRYGADWTAAVSCLDSVPQRITVPGTVIVQGELYWRQSGRIEKKNRLTSGREKVMGFLLSSGRQQADQIGFFAWALPCGPPEMLNRLAMLGDMGFDSAKWTKRVRNIDEAACWREHFYTEPLPFATDGVVLTRGRRPGGKTWEVNGKNWSLAWKYPPKKSVTTVDSILFSVGRTGRITPVIEVEPVEIAGRTIQRVSLGSIEKWKNLDLGIGDQVWIELGGGSCPQIVSVWHTQIREVPYCPAADQYDFLTCTALQEGCEQQFLARLNWLSSKNGLDLRGIGPETWRKLVRAGLLSNLLDWLWFNEAGLSLLPGVGEKKARQWYQEFQLARKADFFTWLRALGAPLSRQEYAILGQKFKQPVVVADLLPLGPADWQKILKVRPKRAKLLYDFFQLAAAKGWQNELHHAGVAGF